MDNTLSCTQALRVLLNALKSNNSSATFFITGEYYSRNQDVVHDILDNGFEVGYHGHTHTKITNKDILHKELQYSESFLKSVKPSGFRAPWIFLPEPLLEILAQNGFAYDSSTFSSAGKAFHKYGIDIFPVTSLQYFGTEIEPIYGKNANIEMLQKEIPIGSGIFVSLLRTMYGSIFSYFEKHNKPVVLYIHDWQLVTLPGKQYGIFKDGLRNTHRFPLLKVLLKWIENYQFNSLNYRLTKKDSQSTSKFSHYLTIDVEHLGT